MVVSGAQEGEHDHNKEIILAVLIGFVVLALVLAIWLVGSD